MGKALEQWQIDSIRKEKAEGKTDMFLAQKYNVHYKTIQNYCKPETEQEEEQQGMSIKVIGMTPGKTLNFDNVTKIEKDVSKGMYYIISGEDMVGILEASNVTAIIEVR